MRRTRSLEKEVVVEKIWSDESVLASALFARISGLWPRWPVDKWVDPDEKEVGRNLRPRWNGEFWQKVSYLCSSIPHYAVTSLLLVRLSCLLHWLSFSKKASNSLLRFSVSVEFSSFFLSFRLMEPNWSILEVRSNKQSLNWTIQPIFHLTKHLRLLKKIGEILKFVFPRFNLSYLSVKSTDLNIFRHSAAHRPFVMAAGSICCWKICAEVLQTEWNWLIGTICSTKFLWCRLSSC